MGLSPVVESYALRVQAALGLAQPPRGAVALGGSPQEAWDLGRRALLGEPVPRELLEAVSAGRGGEPTVLIVDDAGHPLCAVETRSGQRVFPVETPPDDPIEGQLAGYNARDIDAFIVRFAPEVRVETGDGTLRFDGREAKRAAYAKAFAEGPNIRCEILARIVHGDYTVDHERITGTNDGTVRHAVAIYRVADHRISHVRFL